MSVRVSGNRLWLVSAVGLATLLAGGCGSGSNVRKLRGEVTFEGQRVEEGTIEFTPVDGTGGPSAGAVIQDGRYEVPQKHGVLVGGTYKVVIVSMKKTGRTVPGFTDRNGSPLPEFTNYIPAQYNTMTNLRITVAADDSSNHFDFHLQNISSRGADDGKEISHASQ